MDTNIDPVDIGTNVNFVSKTPAYTRVFGLTPRGEGQIPEVTNLGKVVDEYIPQTVDNLIASSQNSFIALYGSTLDTVYFYRTHNEGNQQVLKAWYSWKFPGNVLDLVVDSDVLYSVVKIGSGGSARYNLLTSNLSATLEDEAMITSDGTKINPYMDFYSKATNGLAGGSERKVVFDSTNNYSKCYIPYSDITTATPVIAISGNASTNFNTIVQSGFTMKAERGSDGDGTFFKADNIDLSGQATNVIVGYTFDYDITLPKTYFQLDQGIADYSAVLTVSRMKFSVGRSSTLGFKLKSNGYRGSTQTFLGDDSTRDFDPDFTVQDKSNIKVKKNGEVLASTAYTLTDHPDLTDRIRVNFDPAPDGPKTAAQNVNGTVPDSNANKATAADTIEIYIDPWYDVQPVQEANLYLADDVPMVDQAVYILPIHQRTENFLLRIFSDSPFPVSLTSMMWEGNYSPRYYRRT